jgi:hypothetical protein
MRDLRQRIPQRGIELAVEVASGRSRVERARMSRVSPAVAGLVELTGIEPVTS